MGIVKWNKRVEHRYHAGEIELVVANHFNPRQNLIVPNVSWSMFSHECDVLVLTQSDYAYEVEIKVTASDLKRDAGKTHGHKSKYIKLLWFAMPDYLEPYVSFVPANAGVMLVSRDSYGRDTCRVVRGPGVNRDAVKWTPEKRMELMRLAGLRIWNLKEAIHRMAAERAKAKEGKQ